MKIDQNKARHEFSPKIIASIKMGAAFICANPDCHLVTIGPSETDENLIQYNGKVSHILPASEGGPRDVPGTEPEQRMAAENAIFLCSSCGDLIDKNNGKDYPIDVLKHWKDEHLKWTLANLNRPYSGNQAINIGTNLNSTVGVQNFYLGSIPENKIEVHDLEVFKRLEKIADEPQLLLIWSSLKDYFKCMYSQQNKLDEVRDFLKLSKNAFLNEEINHAATNYLSSLNKLDKILCLSFDKYPINQGNGDYKLELLPYHIHYTGRELDRKDYEAHEREAAKMRLVMPELIESYQKFRFIVKKILLY